MVDFRIINLDFVYNKDGVLESVNARFDASNDMSTGLNGFVRLTKAEYEGTNGNVADLARIAKGKVTEKLAETPASTTTPTV